MAHHQGDVRDKSNVLHGNNTFHGQTLLGGNIINYSFHGALTLPALDCPSKQSFGSNDDERTVSSGDKRGIFIDFNRIYERHSSAVQLLSLMGMFHPRNIPKSLLLDPTLSTSRDDRQEVEWKFERDVQVLLDYSLISLDTDQSSLSMDGFVHHCVSEWLSDDQVQFWKSTSWSALARNIPDLIATNLEGYDPLLPHIEVVATEDPRSIDAKSAFVWTSILSRGAWYANKTGRYKVAEHMSRKALGVRKEGFGRNHYKTIRLESQLARAYAHQMNYSAAERIQSRVVQHQRKTHRANHRTVLLDSSELATTLHCMNDPRAKAIYREILPGLRELLCSKNLSPSDARGINVAMSETLHGLHEWKKCGALDRQILAKTLETFSEHDLISLAAMDRLGLTLQHRNKHQEAETHLRASVQGRAEKLGDRHIDTLKSIVHLADTLAAQHEFHEAAELYKETLDGFKQWVDPQHEIIRKCQENLQKCSGMVQEDVTRPRAESSGGESLESATSSESGQDASFSDGDQAHEQHVQRVDRKRGVFKWFKRA